MVKIGLRIKANLENLTKLKPDGQDFRWYLKLKCQSCGEISKNFQYLTQLEQSELKGDRSHAHLVSKCKLCGRENSLNILPETIQSYNIEDSEKFKCIVVFDCRGYIPVEYEFTEGWIANGSNEDGEESGTKFEVDLKEKEWADYDEKSKVSVGVYELNHEFQKV